MDPVYCEGARCFSYLLSGGVLMATPWIPLDHDDYPLVRIDQVPSIQMEFELRALSFLETDCRSFGAPGVVIAIQLCLREQNGRIDAGLS